MGGMKVQCVLQVTALVSSVVCFNKTLFFYDGQTLAGVLYGDHGRNITRCRLWEFDTQEKIETLKNSTQDEEFHIEHIGFQEMLNLIQRCSNLENNQKSKIAAVQGASLSFFKGIVPGTKWCGPGDVAANFTDLGAEAADICCRAHDLCPVKLKAFRRGFGIINLSVYTKSHCDCDRQFYSCLKNTRSGVADMIGRFYFNFAKVQCLWPKACSSKSPAIGGCPAENASLECSENNSKQCLKDDEIKMEAVNSELRY